MTDKRKIDDFLWECFELLRVERYVCLRTPSTFDKFPFDIDIYVENKVPFVKILESTAFKHDLEVSFNDRDASKLHFDIMDGRSLVLRFDLHFDLSHFKFLRPKDIFTNILLNQIVSIDCTLLSNTLKINVPPTMHEAMLRYLEFYNFFPYNNDKEKHLNWVLKNISVGDLDNFYTFLHSMTNYNDYITFDPLEFIANKPKRSWYNEQYLFISKVLDYYRRYGLRRFIMRVMR